MSAPDVCAPPCPLVEASPGGTPLRQCPQCGHLFIPATGDEWECPECQQEWREYQNMRRELAYPGVWM